VGDLKPLDYVNLGYIWLKTYPSLRKTWSGGNLDCSSVKVNYGYDRVPGPDEHVFGGLVKLQDLSRAFPQTHASPNILYLVSSALPYFPVRLAKMARNAGAKIVVNQNGVAYPGWYGEGYEKANRSMAWLHSAADYVFYQSEFCRVSAEKFLGPRKLDQRSEVLYNPVNTEQFAPAPNSGKDAGVTILLSGSHWTAYRVFTAIDTLGIISSGNSDAALKIAGRFCWRDDPAEAEREVFAYARDAGLGDKVVVTGPYAQQDAPALMNGSSVLLHTKYNDPCPRLVVEALACGVPVVYSATGGVMELVGEGGGLGVPGPLDWERDHPPEPEALAECIEKVIDDREAFARAARNRAVECFNVDRWISRHLEVFNDLMGM